MAVEAHRGSDAQHHVQSTEPCRGCEWGGMYWQLPAAQEPRQVQGFCLFSPNAWQKETHPTQPVIKLQGHRMRQKNGMQTRPRAVHAMPLCTAVHTEYR